MTLRNQTRFDILLARRNKLVTEIRSLQDAMREVNADITETMWLDSARASFGLEPIPAGLGTGQGDDLPRDGERKQSVRYNRGSASSDEGPLRQ